VNDGNDPSATVSVAARALVLHASDNVATALCALHAGESVLVRGADPAEPPVALREPIALCHKFALRSIAEGAMVVKYGESIGRATCAIAAGDHVHTHNLHSARAHATA